MIEYTLLLFSLVVLLVVTNAEADNSSWEGNLPITYYNDGISDCSGNNYWGTGYTSYLTSIGNGELCETDHLTLKDGNTSYTYYTKWVQTCVRQPTITLSSGVYQYALDCTDSTCTNCTEAPTASAYIPWSYFQSYDKCMIVYAFTANTTNPYTEFNDSSINMTVSSELFTGSEDIFMAYWDYFLNYSCIGDGPYEDNTTATTVTDNDIDIEDSSTADMSSPSSSSGGIRVTSPIVIIIMGLVFILQSVDALAPPNPPPKVYKEASLIPNPPPEEKPFVPSPVDDVLLSLFRWTLQRQSGVVHKQTKGFEGMMDELHELRRTKGTDELERVSLQTMTALAGPIPFIYRSIFAEWEATPFLLAWFANQFLGFLVGETKLTSIDEIDAIKGGGLLVERCRVLEGSNCKGICVSHLCISCVLFLKCAKDVHKMFLILIIHPSSSSYNETMV